MDAVKPHIAVIIVAAGSGSRYGAALPKQFCLLEGRPVLMHTIDGLRRALPQARFVLVLSAAMTDYWQQLCDADGFASPPVVAGGATRWESVRNALPTVADSDIVLVHDGARPVVDAAMVARVVDGAVCAGAAIPVVTVTDSLRCRTPDGTRAVDRSRFVAVQTPQGFDTSVLEAAYAQPFSPAFTDDASVVEAYGHDVTTVDGDVHNIKITNPGDIDVARIYMASPGQ